MSVTLPGPNPRICVIGAGPSGITACKNLLEAGLRNVVIYEKGGEVGGNWVFDEDTGHSSVFETTHTISSKTLSCFEDFPMPAHYPDYPHHSQLKEYFQSYARHFGLLPHVRFRSEVTRAEPHEGRWKVVLGDGSVEAFDYLMVANGHHSDPRMPEYPGRFDGTFLHSHDYKRAEPFRGQRLLVIGAGNSACDVAVATSRVAARTDLSMRRGCYVLPKYLRGRPLDTLTQGSLDRGPLLRLRRRPLLRRVIQRQFRRRLYRLQGPNEAYGLQEPQHLPFDEHPTINSEILLAIRHGQIRPKPGVRSLDGPTVHFVDGSSAQYETIIACTGFRLSFPFFDKSLIDFGDDKPSLYLKLFHPEHRGLLFIGLFQPQGCIWPLSDYQSRLAARYIKGQWTPPGDLRAAIEREQRSHDSDFARTPRHATEVDYHVFRMRLRSELAGRRAF